MAEFYDQLEPKLIQFIKKQKIYFIATAPTEGRINLSPKGMDSLICLDSKTIIFLNHTGSGNETAAHLKENGRYCLMTCSFEKAPLILKVYGKGRSIYPDHPEFEGYYKNFEPTIATRQIIHLEVESVQTSCGYAVPFFEYQGERDTLNKWSDKKGKEGLLEYQQENNLTSIDGLDTGLPSSKG